MTGSATTSTTREARAGTEPAVLPFAYVGAYGRGPSDGDAARPATGISLFAVDAGSGALSFVETTPSDNPSFLAVHPTLPVLYAVNEVDDVGEQESGSVEAYAIAPATGRLSLLDRRPSAGAGPAHLAIDPAGGHLVVANYAGGTFAVLPIAADGRLAPASDVVRQHGSGPNQERQREPHPHGVAFDPGGRFVAVADLGTDQVRLFEMDRAAGRLRPVDDAATAPGAGPRHLAFHPGGQTLYVINELDSTIAVFPFDATSGHLGSEIQTVSTLPPGTVIESTTAEIAFHPSGRFLYGSNRAQADATSPLADSLAGFAVAGGDGRLSPICHVGERIAVPRHFAIDPTGTWLYACNQEGNSIVQFAIDPVTGDLAATGRVTETPTPVCLVFAGDSGAR